MTDIETTLKETAWPEREDEATADALIGDQRS